MSAITKPLMFSKRAIVGANQVFNIEDVQSISKTSSSAGYSLVITFKDRGGSRAADITLTYATEAIRNSEYDAIIAFGGTVIVAEISIASEITGDSGAGDGEIAATVRGGVAPLTYAWLDNENEPIEGETTDTLSSLEFGTYTLVVTDAVGVIATETFEVADES